MMNGYERILAKLEGRPTDCLPFVPITMMFAADAIGVPYGRYATDYQLLVAGQLAVAEKFDIDHVSAISDPAREATDLGAEVHFYDDQPPALDEGNSLLAEKSKLESLEVPDPLKPGSRMFDRVRAVSLFRDKVKGRKWIEGWVEGPCAEGSDLRGINKLMLDFTDDPEFVHRLFDFSIKVALKFAKAQIEAGCDILGVGDAAASLVGPRIYKEFVLPYERRLVQGIHDLGGRVRLHICGNISRVLTEIGTLDCDYVDLDYMVSMDAARKQMGEKQVLTTNIDPVKVLRNGTPDVVTATLTQCFEEAGPNLLVGAGCEVPRDTSSANMEAMRDFAKQRT